jgi:hypothetical protein
VTASSSSSRGVLNGLAGRCVFRSHSPARCCSGGVHRLLGVPAPACRTGEDLQQLGRRGFFEYQCCLRSADKQRTPNPSWGSGCEPAGAGLDGSATRRSVSSSCGFDRFEYCTVICACVGAVGSGSGWIYVPVEVREVGRTWSTGTSSIVSWSSFWLELVVPAAELRVSRLLGPLLVRRD